MFLTAYLLVYKLPWILNGECGCSDAFDVVL